MKNLFVKFNIDKSQIKSNPEYDVTVSYENGYTNIKKTDFSNGVFKVVGFTDMHLDMNKAKGNFTMEFLIKNIVREKPDLIVFDGDTVTSSYDYRRAKQFCKVMEKLGVYWTCVLGNHEGASHHSLSRERMMKLFASYKHCLVDMSVKKTMEGDTVSGYGNHIINLLDSNDNIFRSLYLIDGGTYLSEKDMDKYEEERKLYNNSDYDYVKESQIKWYGENVEAINRIVERSIPSVIFDHIPLNEYHLAYEDNPCIVSGSRREGICCPGHNPGFFDVILEKGSTDLVVAGHDHINDFVLKYKGVTLSYNVPGGYSSYNIITKKLGDRLIKGYTRYIFSEDGSFSLEQMRNEDLYPDRQEAVHNLYK